MARAVRPVAGSAKKVFIARSSKEGTPVSFTRAAQAEAVEVVDDPAQAHEVISVVVGSNRADRATAKKLKRAALKEQQRQREGKKDKGVFDQIVADFERPSAPPRPQKRETGISFQAALGAVALGWIGAVIAITTQIGVGQGALALVGSILVVPGFAMAMKFFDLFIPEVSWLVALAFVGVGWGAGLGLIDFTDPHRKGGGDGGGEKVASSAPASNPEPVEADPRTSDEPEPVELAPDTGDWPAGEEAYTILIASKESEAEAAEFAEKATSKGVEAGVLRSDGFTTLIPGYWVAYGEQFETMGEAEDRLNWFHEHGFPDAFVRPISTEPQQPGGTATAVSAGPVHIGMSMADVSDYLAPPDDEQEVSLSAGPAPEIDWIWHLEGGDLTFQFSTDSERLTGYETNSTAFSTSSGLSIGDSFAPIEDEYGDQLRDSPIGEGVYLLSEGDPGTFPALKFFVQRDRIQSIGGGYYRAAGE